MSGDVVISVEFENGSTSEIAAEAFRVHEHGNLHIFATVSDKRDDEPCRVYVAGLWRAVRRSNRSAPRMETQGSMSGAPPRTLFGASMVSDPRLIADMDAENQRLSREWEAKMRAVESAKVPEGIVSGHNATRGTAPAKTGALGALSVLQHEPAYGSGSHVLDAAYEISTYHKPDHAKTYHHGALASAAAQFIGSIVAHTPPGAERSTAISHARTAKMWASAAVALEGK